MTESGYRQFCPVAMAAEVLCTRWTMVLLRELLAGSMRFNELRRGVPAMSPALLSRRLKELEAAGVVRREPVPGAPEVRLYALTEAGRDLHDVVTAIGTWGQRWVEAELSLQNLDVGLLMWDMRRNLDPRPLPARRTVVRFRYPDVAADRRRWWLIVEPDGAVDLCWSEPGLDVNLYVDVDLRTMTEVWLGLTTTTRARADDRLTLVGDRDLERTVDAWLGLSPFATVEKRVP